MNTYTMRIFSYYKSFGPEKLKNKMLIDFYEADDEDVEYSFNRLLDSFCSLFDSGLKEGVKFCDFILDVIDTYNTNVLIDKWAAEVGEKYYY